MKKMPDHLLKLPAEDFSDYDLGRVWDEAVALGYAAGKAKGVLLGLREALRKVKKDLEPFAYAIDAQCVILRAIKRRKEKR